MNKVAEIEARIRETGILRSSDLRCLSASEIESVANTFWNLQPKGQVVDDLAPTRKAAKMAEATKEDLLRWAGYAKDAAEISSTKWYSDDNERLAAYLRDQATNVDQPRLSDLWRKGGAQGGKMPEPGTFLLWTTFSRDPFVASLRNGAFVAFETATNGKIQWADVKWCIPCPSLTPPAI